MRTQLKQTFVHKKLFFHRYLSVMGFKKVSDKNCFAFNTLILASRKQFISRQALRKHYFQCQLANQHLILAKLRDFSTFYTKARGQQSPCTSSKTLNNTFNCHFEEAIHVDLSTLVLIPRAFHFQRLKWCVFFLTAPKVFRLENQILQSARSAILFL